MLIYRRTIALFLLLSGGMLLADLVFPVPLWLVALIGVGLVSALVYGSAVIQSNFYLPAICQGPPRNQMAITFDDGPCGESTAMILDVLKANQIAATFFCIGDRIARYPELVERMHREGHLIGNHSQTHHPLIDFSFLNKWISEITGVNQNVHSLIGLKPRFFRPPFGVTTPHLGKAVGQTGMLTIGWNVRSLDTITDSVETLLTRIRRKLVPGSILLLHDSAPVTVQGLQQIIDLLRVEGLQPVRLDHLIGEDAYQPMHTPAASSPGE
ncbi:MAG: polysaccharide deacetylase family protein [Saprospiraceae bacterium]|nr:polysaccharide deacetylase family protein [Saprospiraceae bacterium]